MFVRRYFISETKMRRMGSGELRYPEYHIEYTIDGATHRVELGQDVLTALNFRGLRETVMELEADILALGKDVVMYPTDWFRSKLLMKTKGSEGDFRFSGDSFINFIKVINVIENDNANNLQKLMALKNPVASAQVFGQDDDDSTKIMAMKDFISYD